MNRLLTRRDKDKSGHKRSRSSDAKSYQSGILSLFKPDSKKSIPTKQDEGLSRKVAFIKKKVDEEGLASMEDAQIEYALQTKFANGDSEKAFELLVLFQESVEGHVRPYDADVYMKGAENRAGVTCYLDALLFAMFARLGSFEPILYTTFDDEPRRRLATLIRLWVNMLRSGKLIQTDITKHLQEALAACGWDEAVRLDQQDTSEAFGFITGKLELPLLTLEMDIYHEGKLDDEDDHKLVNERLLEVAVPTDPGDGKAIRLEDCLEEHFNTRVEVVRRLERRDTIQKGNLRNSFMSGLHAVNEKEGSSSGHCEYLEEKADEGPKTEVTELPERSTEMPKESSGSSHANRATAVYRPEHLLSNAAEANQTQGSIEQADNIAQTLDAFNSPLTAFPLLESPIDTTQSTDIHLMSSTRPAVPHRATSIIRHRVINEDEAGEGSSGTRRGPSRKDSIRKEVLMPAWQFFKIIPWYTTNIPANDTQVADHFKSSRPVLGICLKRYEMNAQGKPMRRNTPIDIPLQIALPHFIQDDKAGPEGAEGEAAPLFGNFNLVLQSMVCHRGNSLHSGHYISIIRGGCKGRDQMPESRPGSAEAPPEYAEDRWIKFDDLASERVSYVDIDKVMMEEMPYLLFYQVQPLFPDDDESERVENKPPAYEDSTIEVVLKEATPSPVPPVRASTTPFSVVNTTQTSYFENYVSPPLDLTKGRLSFGDDQERPRKSLTISDVERRGSLAFTDASTMSMYTNSMPATPNDEFTPTASSRLSRAASRFVKGKSRNGSVIGTERASNSGSINAGFLTNRLNLMRSKELLNGVSDAGAPQHEVHVTEFATDGPAESKPPSLKSTTSDLDRLSIAAESKEGSSAIMATAIPISSGGLGVAGTGIDRSGSKRKKDKGRLVLGMTGDDEKGTNNDIKEKKHHHHHHGLSLGKGKGKDKDKDSKDAEDRECVIM